MAGLPYLIVVDDEPEVRAAVVRDVQRKYGEKYTVVDFPNGMQALGGLTQLRRQGDRVALILSDQRQPYMTGVEFLAASRGIFPDARRALLTAYTDVDVALAAINEARVDFYILKPWDPPEERLYPKLDDMFELWEGGSLASESTEPGDD